MRSISMNDIFIEGRCYPIVDKQKADEMEELDEIKLGMQRLYEAFALGREDAVEMTKVWLADRLGRCVP